MTQSPRYRKCTRTVLRALWHAVGSPLERMVRPCRARVKVVRFQNGYEADEQLWLPCKRQQFQAKLCQAVVSTNVALVLVCYWVVWRIYRLHGLVRSWLVPKLVLNTCAAFQIQAACISLFQVWHPRFLCRAGHTTLRAERFRHGHLESQGRNHRLVTSSASAYFNVG